MKNKQYEQGNTTIMISYITISKSSVKLSKHIKSSIYKKKKYMSKNEKDMHVMPKKNMSLLIYPPKYDPHRS